MTRYVIITPIRDEEKFIEATIASVQAQTVRPAEWVIVDDGSTDRTGEIIDRYAAQVPMDPRRSPSKPRFPQIRWRSDGGVL